MTAAAPALLLLLGCGSAGWTQAPAALPLQASRVPGRLPRDPAPDSMEPAARAFLERIPPFVDGLDPVELSSLLGDLTYLEAVYAPHLPQELAEQSQARLRQVREAAGRTCARRVDDIFSGAYAKRLGRDAKDAFLSPFRWDGGDWGKAAGVLAGTGALFLADRPAQSLLRADRPGAVDRVVNAVEPFGRLSRGSLFVVGGSYAAGKIFDHEPTLKFSGDALEGILLSQAVVHALKAATGRSRPNRGEGNTRFEPGGLTSSFPSGHTAQAFAIATAIAANTKNRWVDVGAYGAAGLVGLHRIRNDKHWLSDVALGAVVGHVVTRWAIDRNDPKKSQGPRRFEVYLGPDPVQGGISGGVRLDLDRR